MGATPTVTKAAPSEVEREWCGGAGRGMQRQPATIAGQIAADERAQVNTICQTVAQLAGLRSVDPATGFAVIRTPRQVLNIVYQAFTAKPTRTQAAPSPMALTER